MSRNNTIFLGSWVLIGVFALLSACSGTVDTGASPAQPTQPTQPPTPVEPPMLVGADSTTALGVIANLNNGTLTSDDINAEGLLLTRIGVLFESTATIGQVNAAAKLANATIASSRQNSLLMEWVIPRQTGLPALLELTKQLRQLQGVAAAFTKALPTVDDVPRNDAGNPAPALSSLHHLRAGRFPAAWNAKSLLAGCEQRPVTIVVTDVFASGEPAIFGSQIPLLLSDVDAREFDLDSRNEPLLAHGYLVTMAMAAKHDIVAPTGAHPSVQCLRIERIPRTAVTTWLPQHLAKLTSASDNLIIQSSIGNPSHFRSGFLAQSAEDIADLSRDMQARMLGNAIEWSGRALNEHYVTKALVVNSAGNERDDDHGIAYRGFSEALFGSRYALVRFLPNIAGSFGAEGGSGQAMWAPTNEGKAARPTLVAVNLAANTIQNFQAEFDRQGKSGLAMSNNVITVGATTPLQGGANAVPFPLADFSNRGATLTAVGQGLALGITDTSNRDSHNGTSYSAPVVSGLAAYLWGLSDDLRRMDVSETIKLMSATAQEGTGTDGFIDAYAAVLALDRPDGDRRVRKAILDTNNDGRFTEADIQSYLTAFDRSADADESRFDLNGDGFTQSDTRFAIKESRMDLDAARYASNGRPQLDLIIFKVDGIEVEVNETKVTDLRALCYFAYAESPALYTGSVVRRDELLGSAKCNPARIVADFPAAIAGATRLTVKVSRTNSDNVEVPIVDGLIKVDANCATVSPATGRSSFDGDFTATVTPGASCGNVTLNVSLVSGTGSIRASTRVESVVKPLRVTGGTVTLTYDYKAVSGDAGNGGRIEDEKSAVVTGNMELKDGRLEWIVTVIAKDNYTVTKRGTSETTDCSYDYSSQITLSAANHYLNSLFPVELVDIAAARVELNPYKLTDNYNARDVYTVSNVRGCSESPKSHDRSSIVTNNIIVPIPSQVTNGYSGSASGLDYTGLGRWTANWAFTVGP